MRELLRRAVFCSAVAAVVLAVSSDAMAEEAAEPSRDEIAKKSLIVQAPIVVDINRRYYKFYGDPNTVHGGILERSYLTDNWVGDGLRDKLVDSGVYLDLGVTQWIGRNVYGGIDTGGGDYVGSMDLLANLDTAKLSNGFWPGATVFLHGEMDWGRSLQNSKSISSRAGSAIPPIYDNTMPIATDSEKFYLSEYYIVQSFSPKVSLWIGQMNGAGLIDGNQFANDEKHQFLNTALVDNPAVGPFAPYTAFTAAAVWLPTNEHVFIAGVMDNQGTAKESVFESYDTDETVFVGSYGYLPEFHGNPGRYQIVGAYSNKDTTSYAIGDRLGLVEELDGLAPIDKKTDNYVSIVTMDQYLYVKDAKRQVGWGLFGRLGWSPKNRNAVDQFYSFGLGGRGCLIPGRDFDFWGLGWAGTHISSDLRDDLELLGSDDIDSFEHVIEAFYNIELLPWLHITPDVQFIINPVAAQIADTTESVKDDGLAIVLGTRMQIDF